MGILMDSTDVELGTADYREGFFIPELLAMGTPVEYFTNAIQTIAIQTRETEFGSIIEPIPIYKQYAMRAHLAKSPLNTHQQVLNGPRQPEPETVSTPIIPIVVKREPNECEKLSRTPPKKKWIKDYMEEEPESPMPVRVVTGMVVTPRINGVVKPHSPPVVVTVVPPPCLSTSEPATTVAPSHASLLDFAQEHSRPRTTSNSHGSSQIPSPPSAGSSGSGSSNSVGSTPRAGIREVHNKLEKNRRAHLKECFELLKRQLPATPDDKKTSNLSILGSAIRYIQVLRRKERECEHEMERLAREKIAAQQRLAALKRELSVQATVRPRSIDPATEDKDREEPLNGHVLGIPISITSSPPRTVKQMEASPPHTLNLSTKLRTLPIQITPTSSQVLRTSYGARHNTLTLTALASTESTTQHNGQPLENGITNALGTTLVHPAQIHLPISQVVGNGGLVVAPAALQLLSAGGGLRVLHTNGAGHIAFGTGLLFWINITGLTTVDNNRVPKENGIVTPATVCTDGSMVVTGLSPLVVTQPTSHLLQTHTLTHKMVKGAVTPLTVSAQYVSATTIMKPVVVVSSAHGTPPPPT